jgi:hypothetical protein
MLWRRRGRLSEPLLLPHRKYESTDKNQHSNNHPDSITRRSHFAITRMGERPYQNREIDTLILRLGDKIDNMKNVFELKMAENHNANVGSLTRIEQSTEAIDKKVAYTNGKVRKITVALVLLAGITIGLGFTEFAPVFSILIGL